MRRCGHPFRHFSFLPLRDSAKKRRLQLLSISNYSIEHPSISCIRCRPLMLRAQLRPLRNASRAWACDPLVCTRLLSDDGKRGRPQGLTTASTSTKQLSDSTRDNHTVDKNVSAVRPDQTRSSPKPSLHELLFPEEARRHEVQQQASREVPRLSIDIAPTTSPFPILVSPESKRVKSPAARELEAQMAAEGPGTSVLVLRNASPNLVEDDFRRLIPQGRHIEGWTLEQGDIEHIIPGRDLATLAPDGTYYLLFTSALSAFTYQGHVTRIHNLSKRLTPSSLNSRLPPPPGLIIDGIDAHAALATYALVPPTQTLELRQLKPPLSPLVASIVAHAGYPSLVDRPERMPFEVRLTLEGPQLHPSRIRYVLLETGQRRNLSWSGGGPEAGWRVRVTHWQPPRGRMPSPLTKTPEAARRTVLKRSEADQLQRDYAKLEVFGMGREGDEHGHGQQQPPPADNDAWGWAGKRQTEKRLRLPITVYIVGFHTEHAALTFVQAWHRRPMVIPGEELDEMADPPIANAEMLW